MARIATEPPEEIKRSVHIDNKVIVYLYSVLHHAICSHVALRKNINLSEKHLWPNKSNKKVKVEMFFSLL